MSLCLIDVHGDIEGDFDWVVDLPRNATNGEVIQAVFPTVDTYFSNVIDMKLWWNAKYKGAGEIHCACTDEEIVKSFIEDVRAVKDLLPRTESDELKGGNNDL